LEVIRRIEQATEEANADVTLTEIGGTVGEYQNILFLEAARMMKSKYPRDVAVVMVSYLPVPGSLGEMKTKPTQTAVRTLNGAGLFADFVIARSHVAIDDKRKDKLSRLCNVLPEHIIAAPDVQSIYDVPLNFEKDHLGDHLCTLLGLPCKKPDCREWQSFVRRAKSVQKEVRIAIVGKYFDTGDFTLGDSYISVIEAVKFSAYKEGVKPVVEFVNAKQFDKDGRAVAKVLKKYDGIVVPGGFGETGIEGKLRVIEYARKNKVPYFGLCYGLQLAVVEYARNVLKLKDANTVEINKKTPHPVIDIMPDQKEKMAKGDYGGTMRLGEYVAYLKEGTIARRAYGTPKVTERHRHRYEVNPDYIEKLEKGGFVFSGKSPDKTLMEVGELPQRMHPFFLGTQFHPELLARPLSPHPLFTAFVKAAKRMRS
jgi:CTP synthase